MWFQLQLSSTAKLTGMVTPLGEFVWRLSVVGRLFNKSNPHVWGLKFCGLTSRHFLPELFHPCLTEMVLRSHVLKSLEFEMILKLQSPELSHYLSWFFKEGSLEVEKGHLNVNVRQCIRARAHPQGSVWVRDFLEHVKREAAAFYRERQKWVEAQERREPGMPMNLKEEPLVDLEETLSANEDSQAGPSTENTGPSREETGSVKEEPVERVDAASFIQEEAA